jgi:hypothetical protein
MKEKGLTISQASKFVKENNLYQTNRKSSWSRDKSGKISRFKKQTSGRILVKELLKMVWN